MLTHLRRGADEHLVTSLPDDLQTVAKRVQNAAKKAGMALGGNDPGMGVDYLFDALDMLRDSLKDLKR